MKESYAVIGGSGAYNILQKIDPATLKQKTVIKTPFGKSSPIFRFHMNDVSFLFISRHGEDRYSITAPFVNYRANIYALKECGVERIISWSGPGAINKDYNIGDLVVPNDLIDETKNRKGTFFESMGIGFIRQYETFCPEIRNSLVSYFRTTNLKYHDKGVYVCTEGPRLETAAEIRKFSVLGSDMVGMTLVPEVFLARELEMCYASVCYITNYAEGIKERPYRKGVLFEGMLDDEEMGLIKTAVDNFMSIITGTFINLSSDKLCHCKDSMLRYKEEGIIDKDWKKWIKSGE